MKSACDAWSFQKEAAPRAELSLRTAAVYERLQEQAFGRGGFV